jgi:hypothetical protein
MFLPVAVKILVISLIIGYNTDSDFLMKGDVSMFKRYVMRIVAPILLLAGCGEMVSPGEDTADASLQRYTVEVRGMS